MENPKEQKFSKSSIIKLSKKADIQSISKDCVSLIDILIQEALEKLINVIISTNKNKIYTINDIELGTQIFEHKTL